MRAEVATHVVVLAIDDGPDDLAILGRHLEHLVGVSSELHGFTNVDAGLAELSQGGYDIVLLDYELGARSGFDVFDELQLRGVEVPIILVTDRGDEEVAAQALRAGFADYISKSVLGPKSLRRAILAAIETFQLRRSLARYHEDLERTVRELNSRNKEIESFYHPLAHELKTPLTAIEAFVSIVLDGLQGPVTGDQRESLEIAQTSCKHMVTCIHDILDSSRLDTGKLAMQREEGSLGDVVEAAVQKTLPVAREKGIRLAGVVEAGCDTAYAAFYRDTAAGMAGFNLTDSHEILFAP
ncbi:MAG: hybrid sensor histidine kinase/response regulator [bacterium]|nr:hybrid sensor histidine kinase/response regulator [bacterium]